MMRRFLLRVLWVGVTLGVAAVVVELGLKLYFFGLHPSPKQLLVASENPTLVYELQAGVEATYTYLNPHQRSWEYRVRVNEDGFRNVPAAAGPSAARIVILGDSYAFGYGVDDNETFAHRLAELLRGRAEVQNWGVPGYNLVQEVELLRARGPEAAADVVIVAFHPNDFEATVFAHPRQVTWMRASHTYAVVKHLLFIRDDPEARIEQTRQKRIDEGRAAFESLLEQRRRLGFVLVLFKVSCWSGVDDREVWHLFAEAQEQGIHVIDLDEPFCAALEEDTIPDDGHPTAEGHELLARRLLPVAEALLERQPSPFGTGRTKKRAIEAR
jgi:lysophospholipase L1-like esterase